ncbi:MAG: NADH-quinone oxidoreductase subunit NuoG [Anaerolineae bacterium]|nr:NADH-quinone oxidoreductase subunit NuoG [Anaerolineae bacterium]
MADLVNLTIDGKAVAVPKGTLIVDAAKTIQNDIPVFCYHPKLKPVGMCRMCLVEIGTPKMDPATRQVVKDDKGGVVIAWQPKLNTACTTPVSEGMAVRTQSTMVTDAREDVLEFLLTSHPLDCPICDKGGECPLQNLTLEHGPGNSRFEYENKQHNDKHVPLGDLIYLDRERCIQCSRCIRFQDDIADDHVLQFHERGRHMEITTLSVPGFDSYFSGNTSDICPVGALTTADFRFKARPWELDSSPSVCNHCAVGCNTTLNTRLDTKTGVGEIKRVMPRQNEHVNEIWLCDKGRFVHHYTRAADRLRTPLMRQNGQLVETTWERAIELISSKLSGAASAAAVVGDRIANEDAYLLAKLVNSTAKGETRLSPALPAAYADLARDYGVGAGFDMKQLGKGDVIVVVNGDVEEQAPVWFLRLRQAVTERGAKLIVAHHRSTKMHRYASHIARYEQGMAAKWSSENTDAALRADELAKARNVLFVFGDDKLDGVAARGLALTLVNKLIAAGHVGKTNSGLLPLYPHGNTQGVFDIVAGDRHSGNPGKLNVDVAWLMGVGDSADAPKAKFTVVSELFMTPLAAGADVVLPALSFAEREGSYTSGDRRVQRFYRAIMAIGQAKPDWWAVQEVARRMGRAWSFAAPAQIFAELAANVPYYAGLSYEALAKTEAQWPPVGRDDLYYGGTGYANDGGVGVRYAIHPAATQLPSAPNVAASMVDLKRPERKLYQGGELIKRSNVVQTHIE